MRNIRVRLDRLESQCTAGSSIYLPRMVRILCRGYARAVAAGIREPEEATEEAVLSDLQSIPSTAGASLAERMEAAISRGKAQRENRGYAQ